MAEEAGQAHTECEWGAQVVQQEQTGWVATGVRQVREGMGHGP